MKHRVFKRYRTKKRGGQRYWIGRKLKKNYGHFYKKEGKEELQKLKKEIGHNPPFSKEEIKKINEVLDTKYYRGFSMQNPELFILDLPKKPKKRNFAGGPLFGGHLKEKGIQIEGTSKEKKIIRRLFERNPELIRHIPKDTSIMFKHLPSDAIGRAIQHHEINKKLVQMLPPHLITKHLLPTQKIELEKAHLPKDISDKLYFKNPTLEQVFKHEVSHLSPELKSRIALRIGSTSLKEPDPNHFRNLSEETAKEAEGIIPERKIKPSEEEVAKSFREVFNR